jgi:hypothetical protein
MSDEQKCPQCSSENVYQDRDLWICPECFHEWDPAAVNAEAAEEALSNSDQRFERNCPHGWGHGLGDQRSESERLNLRHQIGDQGEEYPSRGEQ